MVRTSGSAGANEVRPNARARLYTMNKDGALGGDDSSGGRRPAPSLTSGRATDHRTHR